MSTLAFSEHEALDHPVACRWLQPLLSCCIFCNFHIISVILVQRQSQLRCLFPAERGSCLRNVFGEFGNVCSVLITPL
jgi:hypothetical protein